MNDPSTAFTEAIWRGWLEQTGYHEETMPLEWCRSALAHYPDSFDSRSMIRYMEAWIDGYSAALKDIRS